MDVFLDFESDIEEIYIQQQELIKKQEEKGTDFSKEIKSLEQKIINRRKSIYSQLTPWQRVQVSRHPKRPYTLAYINGIAGDTFLELHGDRNYRDDTAIVGGFGMVDKQSVMFIGHQKGINTKMRQYRNFGMAKPEGYRKALRLMKLAEKFNRPIVTLIDTPGAYPGIGAEERGQGEAIARNLFEMAQLTVPVICFVIGEGASGGALGIGVGDQVFMLENSWYSVISPESCSSILWRSWDYKEKAASSLKLTAKDMLKNGMIDGIIKEPVGGAHTNYDEVFKSVKKQMLTSLKELSSMKPDKLVEQRIKKYSSVGVYQTTT